MDHYRSVTVWENRRRVRRLEGFRDRFASYRAASGRRAGTAGSPVDGDLDEARRRLCVELPEVRALVTAASVSTLRQWFPPPSTGLPPGRIDVFDLLLEFDGDDPVVARVEEILEDALVAYRANAAPARRRSWSPLWWLRRGLTSLGRALGAASRRGGPES